MAKRGQETLSSVQFRDRHKETPPKKIRRDLLARKLTASGESDITRLRLAKMPVQTGSRGLPPAKKHCNIGFTVRFRPWANAANREFEVAPVKQVSGQPVVFVTDGLLACEINIGDRMLPCLLGAGLSSRCDSLRVASAAEHTAALHERFATPVLRRQDTAVVGYVPVGDEPHKICQRREVRHPKDRDAILAQSPAASETSGMFRNFLLCWYRAIQGTFTLRSNARWQAGP